MAALLPAILGDDKQIAAAATRACLSVGPAAIPRLLAAVRERTAAAPGEVDEPTHRLRQLIAELSGPLGGPRARARRVISKAAVPERGGPSFRLAMPEEAGMAPAETGAEPPESAPSPATSAPAAPETGPRVPAPLQPLRATGPEGETSPSDAETAPGWKVVKVFYGTNREPLDTASERRRTEFHAFVPALIAGGATILLCLVGFVLARSPVKATVACLGLVMTGLVAWPALRRTVELETSAARRPGPVYGGDSAAGLELGTCQVTIPAGHEYGELESPSMLHFEFRPDPDKHIVLQCVERRGPDEFYAELKQHLAQHGDSVLVFVHGYNVNFDDAARRTAQMADDLKFAGAPLFFSWPSQGNWHEYRKDEEQVELAVDALKQFLLDVARQAPARSIHLIAHSMGNRALTEALREIALDTAQQGTLFHQVVLAAPDIDADVFRQRIAPAITGKARRVTLYASSNDLALVASRAFNGTGPRAGDSSRGLVLVPGIETVDVSEVDTSLLGHSYYGDSPTVLTDLKELLTAERAADERPNLEAVVLRHQRYWVFREDAEVASRPEPTGALR